jgi:hypothetical protein
MGSRPSVLRAPDVAELSRISVFGCAGEGAGVGAADLSDPFGVAERVDEGAEDGEDAVPGEAVLPEPGCGVSLELAAGEGEGSAEGGGAGTVAGPVLTFGVFAGVLDVGGIVEGDFGSAVGWVWANTKPALQTQKAKVKSCKRRCIGS